MTLHWKTGHARVGDIELAWEDSGPANAEPLLLIMGLGGQALHWPDSLCAALVARGFRVIRYDNRDCGLSSDIHHHLRFDIRKDWLRAKIGLRIPAHYTLHDMAADAAGLLDALGIPRAHVVGVSMGGMIAQLLAARFPHRVASLTPIMSSTNHPRLPGAKLQVLWHMFGTAPKDHHRETIIRRQIKTLKLIGSPAYGSSEEQIRDIAGRAYDRAFRPRGVLRQTHAILATGSFEPWLKQVRAPTQVVHGLADPLLPVACGRRVAKRIRGARLELIPGMGHDIPDALADRWAELIAANAGRH